MKLRLTLLVTLLAAASPFALASSVIKNAPTTDATPEHFIAFYDEVAKMADNDKIDGLTRVARNNLRDADSVVRSLLKDKESVSDLDEVARLRLFNAHEKALAILDNAEDSRLVCEQRKRIGTNLKRLECRTVAELRAERESADAYKRSYGCDWKVADCGTKL